MAIVEDGTQAFGISTASFDGLIVESFSRNQTSNRVDLDDGDGIPLGSKTVPGRVEFSATVQIGDAATLPVVGDIVSYSSATYVITEVSREESQADYQRLSISGYEKIN